MIIPVDTTKPTINFYLPSFIPLFSFTLLQKTPTMITERMLHDFINITIGNSKYRIAALNERPEIRTVMDIFKRLYLGTDTFYF